MTLKKINLYHTKQTVQNNPKKMTHYKLTINKTFLTFEATSEFRLQNTNSITLRYLNPNNYGDQTLNS